MGRVLLAHLPIDEARRRILATERRKLTPRTVTSMRELTALVERARHDGFAIVDQELEIGLTSVAVPILSADGRCVAAMNVSAQSQRMSASALKAQMLPHMLDMQRTIKPLVG
jgi:IclR family pca regulon transcriptional regulator